MKKDYKVYLEDILKAINETEESTKDISFEAFSGNYEKINSVAYNVLIVGEAVDKIPRHIQELYP